jgi:hypothetical protein
MHAIKRKNPLTESFLVQLDVDLEGAGLDSLRLQIHKSKSSVFDKMQACYNESIGRPGMVRTTHPPPTYGDLGMAAFNSPNQNIVDATNPTVGFDNAGTTNGSEGSNEMYTGIPSRQRTTGVLIPLSEMDTSPDGSGDHQHSGGSSTRNVGSSHTSSTAYSPQQQMDPNQLATMFEGGNSGYIQQLGVSVLSRNNRDTCVLAVAMSALPPVLSCPLLSSRTHSP